MNRMLLILLLCISFSLFAQTEEEKKVIQFTGAIVEGDSLQALPFVHITIQNKRVGTISDYYGFFSLVTEVADTIEFSSVGFHRSQFIIPDSLTKNSYSIIHVMLKDTIVLNEFTVFPCIEIRVTISLN